ncbi:tyrosine-type recombinase/integrase [Paraburkholderia xenovorans]
MTNKPAQVDWMDDHLKIAPLVDDEDSEVESSQALIGGDVWRLNAEEIIGWRQFPAVGASVEIALRMFCWYLRSDRAPSTVVSYFRGLTTFFRAAIELKANVTDLAAFDVALFHRVRKHMSSQRAVATVGGALHAFRSWYLWCSDADIEGFDFDTAVALDGLVIGGGPKGEAVLAHDPKLGPLHPAEFDRLFLALREATANEAMPDQDLAAAWLFFAFGCNPKNLYLLHDEDLLKTKMADGTSKYELRIPRIKKPGVEERAQFRTRPLRLEIGMLLDRLVKQNAGARRLIQSSMPGKHFTSAMFRLQQPRETLMGTDFEEQAYRWRTFHFNKALMRVVRHLNLVGKDCEPLNLTPRRLRYTFATRLVQDGASPVILAEALDHTDLQHVMVYYNARSDIVVKLDRAMAMKLAPWAQAFMGTLVRSETEARRGLDPASRVKHFDRQAGKLDNVGSCGSFGFCGMAAPVACYTCSKFQPWLEAPHGAVLDALLADRDAHLSRGADPKMTQARDLTIAAVASVILLCEGMREGADYD